MVGERRWVLRWMLRPVRGAAFAQVVPLEVLPAFWVSAYPLRKMRAVCHIDCKILRLGDWQFRMLGR